MPTEQQVSVTREIGAPAEQVWAMVTDVTRMPEWSPENTGCEWLGDATGPQLGARFRGSNRNGSKSWKTVAKVIEAEPNRTFAFHIGAGPFGIADWRYDFEPTATGCKVTETWTDRRSAVLRVMSKSISGVTDRAAHNRSGMEATLERLAAAAESAPAH